MTRTIGSPQLQSREVGSVPQPRARIAVVGAGWWSTYTHIPALLRNDAADLVAICDTNARALARAMNLANVVFAGHVAPERVPLYQAAADVLVLPNTAQATISREHTSPLKLFEYMAAGRPIVASDLPSLREVLRHGDNAWLVQPDDPAALAQGIQHLLAEPTLAARLAAQAQEEVQAYTWEQRAERILSFVEGHVSASD